MTFIVVLKIIAVLVGIAGVIYNVQENNADAAIWAAAYALLALAI